MANKIREEREKYDQTQTKTTDSEMKFKKQIKEKVLKEPKAEKTKITNPFASKENTNTAANRGGDIFDELKQVKPKESKSLKRKPGPIIPGLRVSKRSKN